MKIRILFFSVLQDIVGAGEIEEELPLGQTWKVSDLLERLYVKYDGLRIWDGKILVALDMEYVDRDEKLADGQELAIMPPVQGG
ncbi:MAG: MoaD/ThiS family protein [Verrucomicrobia bacterium]|nr:MoaD/ThiS family protein [Verrucomicrobiota bacterium]